jgi:hypothetical protein
MKILSTKAKLLAKIKELGILNPSDKWESGGDHHPKSIVVYQSLSVIDMNFSDDYFCWKSGGDGDNGEQLMYELDMVFELEDKGYRISKEAWQ